MRTTDLIDAVHREGLLLAGAAERAGQDAPVPTCPGWTVRDLLRHQTMVHRWAGRIVGEALPHPPAAAEPDLAGDALLDHYREGHRLLVDALTKAPADLDCWHFFRAPSPLAFWARRQAHETTVHRVDAESARGGERTPLSPEFAADGIAELLAGFHGRARSRVRTDEPRTLRVQPTDTDDVWTVHLSQDPPRTETAAEGGADCTLRGPAETLYLTLWNRLPHTAVRTDGDPAVAALWRSNSTVTWN